MLVSLDNLDNVVSIVSAFWRPSDCHAGRSRFTQNRQGRPNDGTSDAVGPSTPTLPSLI
jgi:hypothetical protein